MGPQRPQRQDVAFAVPPRSEMKTSAPHLNRLVGWARPARAFGGPSSLCGPDGRRFESAKSAILSRVGSMTSTNTNTNTTDDWSQSSLASANLLRAVGWREGQGKRVLSMRSHPLERQWSLLDLEDRWADEALPLQRVPGTAQCAFGILSGCLREPIPTGHSLAKAERSCQLRTGRVKRANWDRHACATPSLGWRYRPLPTLPGELADIDRSQLLAGVSRFRAASEQPLDLGFFVIRSKVRKHAQSVCSPKSEVTQRKQNLAESMGLRRQSGLWRLVARGAQSALLCDEFLSESVSRLRALPAPVRRLCSL
jgi:hypothetical protein